MRLLNSATYFKGIVHSEIKFHTMFNTMLSAKIFTVASETRPCATVTTRESWFTCSWKLPYSQELM